MTNKPSRPALAAAERLARSFLEQAAEAVVVCDGHGRVIRASQAAQLLCDTSPLRRPFDEAFPLRAGASRPFLLAPVLGGRTLRNVDVVLDGHGQTVHLLLNAGPLHRGRQMLGCLVTLTNITELKQAEETLRESEARYRALAEASQDSIFIVGRDGRLQYINPAGARPLGRDAAELTGTPITSFFPPETIAAIGPALQKVFDTGRPFNDIARLSFPGGTRWLDSSLVGLVDATGGVTAVMGVGRDITARKQAEERLRESEGRLTDVIFSVADWVWEVDQHGVYTYSSERGYDLLGRSPEDIIGKTPFDFMPPDEAKRVAAIFSEIAAAKAPISELENWNIRKNGERICLLTSAVPILDAAGNLTGYRGADKDITGRKEAERQLHLQAAALDAAANAIVITGLDGTIEWINAAFTTLTGYDAHEAIGKNPRELVKSGVHTREFYSQLWETILAGKVWQGEMTNRRKDGSLYAEEQTVTPVRDARGEVAHFIAIKRDLTEHHEMEARFRQSQKMETVGQLAGGIAHDFNNLLTVILTVADLALGQLKEGDPLHADFEEVRRAAERAAGLTRQLLAFSSKQLLQPTVLDLNAVLAGMQAMLRRLIGENIELVFAPAGDLGSVKADLGQLEQVIMNLVVNARDAMPHNGRLTIETRNLELDENYAASHPSVKPGPYVMLAISDTGVGMDVATRERIFEPFFTTKALGKGSGLGLSTVYGIVSQSGGTIGVYSEPGTGTTFKICLRRVDAVAHTSPPAAAAASGCGTETVLIAEDDAGVRHAAMRLLQLGGYTVLSASSGTEALSTLERHDGPVHLMLTDMVMPGMSGRELAALLKDVRPEMKIIFTSGYTNDVILQDGLLDETAHFIGKPYTAVDLRRKVREVLDS